MYQVFHIFYNFLHKLYYLCDLKDSYNFFIFYKKFFEPSEPPHEGGGVGSGFASGGFLRNLEFYGDIETTSYINKKNF